MPQVDPINPVQTYQPSCPNCGGLRRRVGFVPDADCAECRVDRYRCELCGQRSETTVCSLPGGPPKPKGPVVSSHST
jgi:hypothetical protein